MFSVLGGIGVSGLRALQVFGFKGHGGGLGISLGLKVLGYIGLIPGG